MSPTQRAKAHCKANGWLVSVVEQWVPGANIRRDAFGFGDMLVLDGQGGPLLVQVTSTNVAARVAKIRGECWAAARAWIDAGGRVQVWGWAKRGPAGKRKMWTLRVVDVEGESCRSE